MLGYTGVLSCIFLSSPLPSPPLLSSLLLSRTSLRLLGGREPTTESWQPATSSWQPSSPLPEGVPLDGCSAALSPSSLLVTGGHLCPQCTFLYSLVTEVWQRLEDMGEGRTSHGCTAYTDPENGEVRVLVAGGWAGHDVRTAEVTGEDR